MNYSTHFTNILMYSLYLLSFTYLTPISLVGHRLMLLHASKLAQYKRQSQALQTLHVYHRVIRPRRTAQPPLPTQLPLHQTVNSSARFAPSKNQPSQKTRNLSNHDIRTSATKNALSSYTNNPVDYGNKNFYYIKSYDGAIHFPSAWELSDGSVRLPATLQTLPVDLKQLQVIRQYEPGSCGSRCIANALAIQQAVQTDKAINSQNIRMLSQKHEHLHKGCHSMKSTQQMKLGHDYGLKNCYCIGLDNQIMCKSALPSQFIIFDSTDYGTTNLYQESELHESIIHNFRTNNNCTAHFICHLGTKQGGHGVLVSLVKKAGQPTKMFYMDSNNIPLLDNNQATAYIKYLFWSLVA